MSEETKPRIVTVGACITDLISYSEYLPKPGETVVGSKFIRAFGGKGANQLVQAAKLGASTAMVAKLGYDQYGDDYLQNFRDLGVNVQYVTRSETFTAIALIMVDKNAQHQIFATPGASAELGMNEVKEAENIIINAKVLMLQLDLPWEATQEVARTAKKHNVCTIINVTPACKAFSIDDVCLFDVIVVNENEMEALVRKPVGGLDDAKEAVKDVVRAGAKVAIVTLGALGTVWANCEHEAYFVPADKVTAVDTTGAGDSFMGALAYYFAYKDTDDMMKAVTFANKMAAMSVQKPGAQFSYPTRDAIPDDML